MAQAPDSGDAAGPRPQQLLLRTHSPSGYPPQPGGGGALDAHQSSLLAQGSSASSLLDAAGAGASSASVAAVASAVLAMLPPSAAYASSCRAFTWPLLAPQCRVSGAGQGDVDLVDGSALACVMRDRSAGTGEPDCMTVA